MRSWKLLEATRLDDSELFVPLSEEFLGFESVCLGWFRGGLRDYALLLAAGGRAVFPHQDTDNYIFELFRGRNPLQVGEMNN